MSDPIKPAAFRCPVFLDVEATGLRASDRVVSLGMLRLDTLEDGRPRWATMSLIFDPLKASQPEALRVHGLDDWTLRHQPLFGAHIADIVRFLERADGIVCHNAAFDIAILMRAFQEWHVDFPPLPVECTLDLARKQGLKPATLSACAERLGLQRRNSQHSALEDAALCAAVWLKWRGTDVPVPSSHDVAYANWQPVPLRPRKLPLRRNVWKRAQLLHDLQTRQEKAVYTAKGVS